MAPKQKLVVWLWALAVAGIGICPPWIQNGRPGGYHLIFWPPRFVDGIDVYRLVIQWLVVSAIGCALYFACPTLPHVRLRLSTRAAERSLVVLMAVTIGSAIIFIAVLGHYPSPR